MSLQGEKASQRMGAALIAGVGLAEELIVHSETQYEERAVQLALEYQNNRRDSELQRCKQRLPIYSD